MTAGNIRKISDEQPALSIIVPVYNTELFLARCMDSLLGQTIKDIEIICIDDKSTDGSLRILREYEKKDNRIKVITQEKNSGVSIARNTGLAVAAGEYIGFVDSDDFVDFDFYEKLYDQAASTDADITKGEALKITHEEKTNFGPSFEQIRKNKANFGFAFLSAIYKRDFLIENEIYFPLGVIIGEDIVFLTKAAILANKIELVEGVYYRYIRKKDSLDSDMFNIKKIESIIESENMVIDFINDKIADDKEVYNIVFVRRIQYLLSMCHRSCTFHGCLIIIRALIGLYKKCKYKDDLYKYIDANYVKFLSEENEVALFICLFENVDKFYYIKLFTFIPFFKIIYKCSTMWVRLFNLIPLLKVENRSDGECYYLFDCIPIIKKTTKIL